jgi:NAD(P)H-hydrate epimerase
LGWKNIKYEPLGSNNMRRKSVLKVVSTEEMQRVEKAADAGGLSYDEMMSNAGASIAEAILNRWTDIQNASVLILVGPGNNGGDGLVVGHHLHQAGAEISLYLSHPRSASNDHNFARLEEAGVKIYLAEDDKSGKALLKLAQSAEIVIDALLGTGISLPLRGTPEKILSVIQPEIELREERPFIVAVDCPSGLDCDSGAIARQSLHADLTVTLAAAKPGLFEFPGAEYVGEMDVGFIGLPDDLEELNDVRHYLVDQRLMQDWLPGRPLNAHKGTFGHVVILAGSINFPGAAALSALGAYRSGAGLVTLAVPSVIQPFIVPGLPEVTWIALPHEMGVISKSAVNVIREELDGVDALLIGPGFGRDPETKLFLELLLEDREGERSQNIGFIESDGEMKHFDLPPCVIDADGLKLLSEITDWSGLLQQVAVLTPHPGEFAIMTGLTLEEILSDRVRLAREYARRWGHVLVLKGAFTIVAAPDGRLATVPVATPALATAGTGDVLAGIIVSLRGQGLDAFKAAVAGAYLHAHAGLLAAQAFGTDVSVMAGDVAEYLPDIFADLV